MILRYRRSQHLLFYTTAIFSFYGQQNFSLKGDQGLNKRIDTGCQNDSCNNI